MVSQVVENQTRVSKISILLACKSTYSEEICVYCTKRQRRDIKNRAFSEFKVNFQGLLSTKSSCKQFSLKNIKLEEQLLLKSFLVLVFYQKVPAARALSSPSGEAAEDNVVEREKFWGGRNYGFTGLRNYGLWITDNRRTDRRGI